MDELVRLTAREAVARLARREISPLELIEAALARITETDGALNALPTLCAERARAHAERLMASPPDDPPPWHLHGLPIAVKDMTDVAGVRTTYGSPIYADHVPERSGYEVERLEKNGAVVLAKSNTPELAAGANTFNEVFGRTCNPWDTALTPGGSSGGSAVALAAGQVWLATGSDMGGSLRIPASYCGVVGIRPAPGRVAAGPRRIVYQALSVAGPMARNVAEAGVEAAGSWQRGAWVCVTRPMVARQWTGSLDGAPALFDAGASATARACSWRVAIKFGTNCIGRTILARTWARTTRSVCASSTSFCDSGMTSQKVRVTSKGVCAIVQKLA